MRRFAGKQPATSSKRSSSSLEDLRSLPRVQGGGQVRCAANVVRMSSRSDEQMIVGLEDCRVAVVAASMPAHGDVAEVADVFGLLADPGRLRVLVALLEGEMCVCDLAAVAQASESA